MATGELKEALEESRANARANLEIWGKRVYLYYRAWWEAPDESAYTPTPLTELSVLLTYGENKARKRKLGERFEQACVEYRAIYNELITIENMINGKVEIIP